MRQAEGGRDTKKVRKERGIDTHKGGKEKEKESETDRNGKNRQTATETKEKAEENEWEPFTETDRQRKRDLMLSFGFTVCVCVCVRESPDVIGRWSVRACPVSLVERSESCDLQEAVGEAEKKREKGAERERQTDRILVRSTRMLWPEHPNHNKWQLYCHLSYWAHTQIPIRSEHPRRPWLTYTLPQCISAKASCGKVAQWCYSTVLNCVILTFYFTYIT